MNIEQYEIKNLDIQNRLWEVIIYMWIMLGNFDYHSTTMYTDIFNIVMLCILNHFIWKHVHANAPKLNENGQVTTEVNNEH